MFGIQNQQQNQQKYGFYKENEDDDSNKQESENSYSQHDGDGDSNRTNLIVNYLPQTMTDKDLYTMFVAHGPLDNVRIMKDFKTGYSYGFGFVKFVNPDDAARAITALNGVDYYNKRIKVSYARPPGQDIKFSNLYVTNLPKDFTEQQIDKLFGDYGQIVQKNLLKDKITGMPRGVAFVRFSKREEAQAAIQNLHGKFIDGCLEAISVRVAEEHGKQKATYYEGWKAGFQMNKDRGSAVGYRHLQRGGLLPRRGVPPFGRGAFQGPTGRGHRFNPLAIGGGDMNLNNYNSNFNSYI